MTLVDVLTLAVLFVVGARLFEAARASVEARRKAISVVRGLRLRHFLWGAPVIVAVIGVAFVLIQLPVLSFGWWTALGGEGNPVLGTTDRSLGVLDVAIPIAFASLLVVSLPLLVAREEWVFRRGAEHRGTWTNIWRSLLFGLAHAVIGIPLGAALALSIGGLYLTGCYLRGWRATRTQAGALLESTRAHLAYNTTILALVAAALAAAAVIG
ncbi:MAG TPA: hypothetical protein VF152_10880 [Acidimicrobiia bacterium]